MDINRVIKYIKDPKAAGILSAARALSESNKKHITGEGYHKWLDQRIKTLESDRAKEIKKQLAKPTTKGIFKQILGVYSKIFRADGTIRNYNFKSETSDKEKELKEILKTVANGDSLERYMVNKWFKYLPIDFMGVEMVELKPLTQKQIDDDSEAFNGVTINHYSVDEIHDIHVVGSVIEYIIFRWIEKHNDKDVEVFRVVDEDFDTLYIKSDGEVSLYPEGRFDDDGNPIEPQIVNPFGQVPAIQTSQRNVTMDDTNKSSWLNEAMENAELYLSISDDHTACVKIYQHPILYSYPVPCHVCDAEGELYPDGGDPISCHNCTDGYVSHFQSDVTKGITVPFNKWAAPDNITTQAVQPPIGYATIDHESLGEQRVEMEFELDHIERAALGMTGLLERKDKQETDRSKEVDMQPVLDVLNMISKNAEDVERFLTDMIGKIVFPDQYVNSNVVYGRKYHIKTVDQITEEIKRAKESGANESFLMELQTELYQTRFENNKRALDRAMLLLHIEPYPTRSVEEVNALGISDEKTLMFKLNFVDLVEEFEQLHGDITLYRPTDSRRKKLIEEEMIKLMEEKEEPIIE